MMTRKGMISGAFAALAALPFGGCGRACERRELEWTSLGTVARIRARADSAAAAERACAAASAAARRIFADVERLLSAFDPGSELSRLAPLSDERVIERCSPLVRPCYEAAFALAELTGGRFSPRWKGPGTLDLGAIAKGFAVDLAAEAVAGGESALLVDLGGNLKAAVGEWTVGVRDPRSRGSLGAFALEPGAACATSGEYERGRHIRDGRTGEPIVASVGGVTVIHPSSAMLADGLSTVMFILGRDEGGRFLARRHPEARAIWC